VGTCEALFAKCTWRTAPSHVGACFPLLLECRCRLPQKLQLPALIYKRLIDLNCMQDMLSATLLITVA